MAKKKKESIKPVRTTIVELEESRTGGQIALSGFSYQFLYSCYLILSESNENTTFHLEGLEDIDHYSCEVTSETSIHIQLKFSTIKQDASFLKDVLKNFLEAYLIDNNHNFKLVFDFTVAKGNLSKLFDNCLDESSIKYWEKIVQDIKAENAQWNWTGFSFDCFIKKLSFEKQEKNELSEKIEKLLIEQYDITTGNISLFANGIKICCLEKMELSETINQHELNTIIQSIKDDISKGIQNPAHNWIKKLDFNISNFANDQSYFEGKKATPQDIAMQLPIRREHTEKEIEESIQSNRVTVIKASSGQGKTTMAFQVAFNLRSEYTIYQLMWCNDAKELNNIIQYFKSRVKLGEKPLIVIDNLDSQLSEWNRFAQLLQEEVSYHYKLLLTTREDDWYNYSGNLSNVRSLKIVKLSLNEQEAKLIFEVLQKAKKLHQSITDWRSSWAKVSDKKLLIEFVYLLTHGEMISERIAHQIYQINNTDTGRIKCEILRKVCLADICGIKISVSKLIGSLLEVTNRDYGDLLKSVENEFLIRIDSAAKYVEGLHPVRSQHIVDYLHEFSEISDTALQVVKITDVIYMPKLFSKLPELIVSKKDFYSKIVELLWDEDDLSPYVLALKGLLSGSVMQYYVQNQGAFDEANDHGGLFVLSTELNPFTKFEEFNYSLHTLDELKKITPDNVSIQSFCDLRDSVPKIALTETDIYYFCEALFDNLKNKKFNEISNDISSYATIAYWLLNINLEFNLSNNISLKEIWATVDECTIEVISSIMYTCFCGNRDNYTTFVNANLSTIMIYLKRSTESLKLFISEDGKEIHVEYLLLPSNIKNGKEESVSRIKMICKTLPIFETYCADSIMPAIEFQSGYEIPDDAHKAIPIRNIIIMFHGEFASLWDKTIMSNYECDSIYEWIKHWFYIRKNITNLSEKCVTIMNKLLEIKKLGNLSVEIEALQTQINKELIREFRYPNQDRPFDEKAVIPEGINEIKIDYFGGIQNFSNQLFNFLHRDLEQSRLALFNLTTAYGALQRMQQYFRDIVDEQLVLQDEHNELCMIEERGLLSLLITSQYYQEHLPDKYYSKYATKSWYDKKHKQTMLDSKTALSGLSEDFFITYPEKYYNDGVLRFYPIIADNLDMTNPVMIVNFLYLCNPFASLDYNYLVVAYKNKQNKIMPRGLKIPNQFLKELKVAIDTEDEELMQKLSPTFPEEIAQQFLDCFEQKFELFIPICTGYEGLDTIFELLWAFSRAQKELTAESDSNYLQIIEENLKKKVFSLLKIYETKITYHDFHELVKICEDTFKGNTFGEVELNACYNKLISKTLEQLAQQ